MANGDITKEISYDKIEVVNKWNIQVRELTKILEEQSDSSKKLISHSFRRSVVIPFDSRMSSDGKETWTHTATDISSLDSSVQAICNTSWTDAVKAEYKTWRESRPYGGGTSK